MDREVLFEGSINAIVESDPGLHRALPRELIAHLVSRISPGFTTQIVAKLMVRGRGTSIAPVSVNTSHLGFKSLWCSNYQGPAMKLLITQSGLPRVSWGSVFTGVILSLIVYLVLTVLGTAIGTSAFAPLSRYNPLEGYGFGSGAYLIVMTVIAVFVGAYFAGRCAPVLGWLHGLLAWAVMILLVAYGAASLFGTAVGAAGSVASAGVTVAATADRPGIVGTMAGALPQQLQGAVASATAAASSPQAQADARQAADTAARNVARASWFSFAALIVGAIIAIVSGHAGFKHQPPFEEAAGVSTDNRPVLRDPPRSTVSGRTAP
jgi:hypothetical protein